MNIEMLALLGIYTIWITPLTLVMGLIYSIKKPEEEATPYKIMAVVSAYLIIITFIFKV